MVILIKYGTRRHIYFSRCVSLHHPLKEANHSHLSVYLGQYERSHSCLEERNEVMRQHSSLYNSGEICQSWCHGFVKVVRQVVLHSTWYFSRFDACLQNVHCLKTMWCRTQAFTSEPCAVRWWNISTCFYVSLLLLLARAIVLLNACHLQPCLTYAIPTHTQALFRLNGGSCLRVKQMTWKIFLFCIPAVENGCDVKL